jgi:uncharacterized protein (DUF342 family)
MAIRAKSLASTGKLLQNLLRQKKQLTAEIGPAPENAQIYIREAIYPNVTISLGSSRREQKEKGGPLRFFLLDKKAEVAWLDEQQLCS